MPLPNEFLSCDWGTSSFRLRRVSEDLKVVAEVKELVGVRAIFEKGGEKRADLFAEFLRGKLEELGGQGIPLVISGMASSSIGWKELAYAKAPFALDGAGLRVEELEWAKPEGVGKTFLVSGVATERDVMRGEETQIVGIMAEEGMTAYREGCVLVLPGTHSKHVFIEGGMVRDFATYMTGEVFEVMGRHSILKATVDLGAEMDVESFREGVLVGKKNGLAGSLFSVRARGVIGGKSSAQNSSYLSGVVIGDELADLADGKGPVIIAASGGLAERYEMAMRAIASSELKWISLPPEQIEKATVAAHKLILEKMG